MKISKLALLAIALAGSADAQTTYYARERLVGLNSQPKKNVQIVNGGFETGTLDPWIKTVRPTVSSTIVKTGQYSLVIQALSTVSQTLETDAIPYEVSMNCYATSGGQVSMLWNGTVVKRCGEGSNYKWVSVTATVMGTGGSDTLTIKAPDSYDRRVDDIAIRPL